MLLDAPYFAPGLSSPSDAYTIACALAKPISRGSVRLADREITSPPLTDPNYLGDQQDVVRLLAGVELARDIGRGESMKIWNNGEVFPGSSWNLRSSITDYLQASILPSYHLVGTCRMGSDSEAVVDPRLRVLGVAGLRIADASVMPSIIAANTNATVLAIAERRRAHHGGSRNGRRRPAMGKCEWMWTADRRPV